MQSVLIIGMGRFGRHMAMQFQKMDAEVLGVDSAEERINEVMNIVDDSCIGDATNEEFLKSLGVGNFDLCVVAIGTDFQSSLETTSLLKELGAKLVLSRASRDVQAKFLLRNGADAIVYPERMMAAWAAIRYSSTNIFDFTALNENYGIYEVATPEKWVGRTVGELDIRRKHNINILAFKDGEQLVMDISHTSTFNPAQHLLVLGAHEAVEKTFHLEG